MENSKKIANLILPRYDSDISKYTISYPPRKLPRSAIVTRFTPTLTGLLHIGGMYSAIISKKFADQTNGLFVLRIDDIHRENELKGDVTKLIETLQRFGLKYDEGPQIADKEIGLYGPYIQSSRTNIYGDHIKYLVEKNKAYPCFYSHEALELLRKRQEHLKIDIGYYDQFAAHSNMTDEEIIFRVKNKERFVIRFRNRPNTSEEKTYNDFLKGAIALPNQFDDVVLMRSNGLPTYHLSHVVDDHLNGSTHIFRADDWISSLPLHLKLYEAFNFAAPIYGHVAPIQKQEGASRRKLSREKDPKEASIDFYESEGYPPEALLAYLLTIANSDFEKDLQSNDNWDLWTFEIRPEKFSKSGALFDLAKVRDISKNYLDKISNEILFVYLVNWANRFDFEFHRTIIKNSKKVLSILDIGRNSFTKRRKDYAKMSDIKPAIWIFFDHYFKNEKYPNDFTHPTRVLNQMLDSFLTAFDRSLDQQTWFENMKRIANSCQFATSKKEFELNPGQYNGDIAAFMKVIREVLTKSENTFELYEILQVLDTRQIEERVDLFKTMINSI